MAHCTRSSPISWGEYLVRPCYYKGERENKSHDLEPTQTALSSFCKSIAMISPGTIVCPSSVWISLSI